MEYEAAVGIYHGGKGILQTLMDNDPKRKLDIDNLICKIDEAISTGTQASLHDAKGACHQLKKNYRINSTQKRRLEAMKDRAEYGESHYDGGGGAGAADSQHQQRRYGQVATALGDAVEHTKKKETKYFVGGKLRTINRDAATSID